ncbi:hypothetical protein HA49_15730 [Tatumella morbirosei]|uniref:AsmA domain-containing protein n=1 Tax=Tatumella morbirosei TaxID=642227 RepID=A0A095T6B2_9GAMM|nr:outer membrane assembly protein AsmA [Tatumella morbirosei]KGD72202.1 hypothetical protein HA49_15730 [Tatumella morbirosei]
MRRLITTLAILLVVVVAGMTALVMLVNPNQFRGYMAQEVAKRSGYQLKLSGDLRWHVWPRLSILSDQVSLTAPGATDPAVSAENMRLDVELMPLLSHQLKVSQVLLKNAVIRDLPATTREHQQGEPVAPPEGPVFGSFGRGWSFNIARLNIADSLFIWQDAHGNQINFRDVNLTIHQPQYKQGNFEFSGRASRNQQNLVLDVRGSLDATQYPHQLGLQVSRASYKISGVDLPADGINGQASFNAVWKPSGNQFDVTGLLLEANNSDFTGELHGHLLPAPALQVRLNSKTADFDQLLTSARASGSQTGRPAVRAPVIADTDSQPLQEAWLRDAMMDINIHADSAVWRGLQLKQLQLSATNAQGLMTINTLTGELGNGHFSLPGQIDLRSDVAQVTFAPDLQNIQVQPALAFLQLPQALRGELTMKGQFSGQGLSNQDILNQWHGQADVSVSQLDTAPFNLRQMVSDAVARTSDRVHSENVIKAEVPPLKGNIRLVPGNLTLSQLQGENSDMKLTGLGNIDFAHRTMDVTFGLMMKDWKGDNKLVKLLSEQAVPVRFYGPWSKLQYSLPVSQLLNGNLRNEMKKRINQWVDHNSKPGREK